MRWYIRSSWREHLLFLGVGGAAIACSVWGGWPIVAGFLAGLTAAVLLRDLRWYIRLVRAWPLTSRIIDWNKLDDLLEGAVRVEP